jgi:schlafen family protein
MIAAAKRSHKHAPPWASHTLNNVPQLTQTIARVAKAACNWQRSLTVVDMETHTINVLAEYLATQRRVWVRIAANLPDKDWKLVLFEVTTCEPPPGWHRQRWDYPTAVFVAAQRAGTSAAKWLTQERIALPSLSLKVPLAGSVHVERRDSNFEGLYERLAWPTMEWTVPARDSSGQVGHGELVAADAPAFISFDEAAGAFFGLPARLNRNFSGKELVLRQQDRCARIDRVLVGPTQLAVDVSGHALQGARLTLGGLEGPSRRLSKRTRHVRLPALDALQPHAWLALHNKDELLDRRILDPSWGGKDFEVEVDAATRVQVLISGGERASVEFKRELPSGDPRRVMKTIAAFANGNGGTLLFGVENDGKLIGVDAADGRNALDRLTNMISDWVRPLPDFDCEVVHLADCRVLAVNVAPGSDAPCGVGTEERDIRYYIRRAGTTFPASPADIRALVQARTPATSATYFPRS